MLLQVLEELFRSANGAVMKVRRREDNKVYVLKERRTAELGAKEDVLHEVTLLMSISHPNVIKCYGHFLSDFGDIVYIVLEYATRGDLYKEVLRRKSLREFFAEDEIWSIFEQCVAGLAYLHSMSIVHRDIKVRDIVALWCGEFRLVCSLLFVDMQSLNILRTDEGGKVVVKIADLGVGRKMSQHTVMLQVCVLCLSTSVALCKSL
jgi:serine/threonine protein kinase